MCTVAITLNTRDKVEQPSIPSETYIRIHEWIMPYCLLSRSSNALRVNTGDKPCYKGYIELRF